MIFHRALLRVTIGIVLAGPAAAADPSSPVTHPVTATPPLQVVPATPVSKNVQQRMRNCNSSADAKKLAASARETFIKSCMASHRSRTPSRAGSEPKPNP
jgi:psiF repeat